MIMPPFTFTQKVIYGLVLGFQTIGFAVCLASVITLLLKGYPILYHGLSSCSVFVSVGHWEQLLYTPCGCAVAVLAWFFVSLLGLWVLTPKIWRGFYIAKKAYTRKQNTKR
jgi:hypothetical protein